MIFGKNDHLVGLDIGSSFIKVAEIKATGKGHVLNKFGMSKIAPGTIVEGRIVDVDGLANDIKVLFKSQKIREKNVAISTGGHSVVIKTINTLNKPEKELHETIYTEAEQYIPYDIGDVNIDYQVLGQSELEEIRNQYDISVDDAYLAVNGENSTIAQDKIQAISLKIAQGWCSEICEVVNTYQAGSNDEKVENIVLSGGGVFVEGFQESLLSELEADVSIINPFEALNINEQKFSDSFITKASPIAPIAIGLALRRVDDK